jgi:hypothetical protein
LNVILACTIIIPIDFKQLVPWNVLL